MQTFAVYVDNKPGVLNRVASLFRRRAFNIESLTVGHTETAGVSRMTVVVDTDEYGARRLEAHLYKLVPCRRVDNITSSPAISRDLALIKVAATGEARTHVMQLVDVYRARIVDVSPESLVIETTGTEDKIGSLLEVLRPYGVVEMVRTGRVAMARGTVPARRRHRDDVCGRNRDRPVRRAGRAVRRRERADQGGLRDARRCRLSAGDRVL